MRRQGPDGLRAAVATGVTVQTTLAQSVTLAGFGLHTGRPVRITLAPAPAGSGIVFTRTDLATACGRPSPHVPARWDAVEQVPLCTRLVNADGVSVSTVEHLMAAFAGCGVHNAAVSVSGPELPVLDGSAAPFARAILGAGIAPLDAPLAALEVLRPVAVCASDGAWARLEPAPRLSIAFEIEFVDAAIGRQCRRLEMNNGSFLRELADSRTFCRRSDVDLMQEAGFALGGSLDNAVVVEGAQVLNPGGLRHADEPVRHKMLDALGDLALAGGPLLGAYTGVRAGHALTNQLLRTLFATEGAYRWRACDPACLRDLPGACLSAADLAAVA